MTPIEAAEKYYDRLQWAMTMAQGRAAGLGLAVMVEHVRAACEIDEETARKVVLEVVKEHDPTAPWYP